MNYIPVLSTLVTFAFTYSVFQRYLKKGGMHLLLWAVGLLLYGLGTLSEVILSLTFNELILKLWYLTGAMLTAAWLGQGSIQLLVRKGKLTTYLTYALLAVSLLAVILVMLTPLTGAQVNYNVSGSATGQYKSILTRSGLTLFLTILLNIYGTIGLVGGAVYSAFLFWRKKVLVQRMFGNLFIAAGALLPAMAGSLVKVGILDLLYISEFFGSVLMYIGFMLAIWGKD